jgi:hypothetical protein
MFEGIAQVRLTVPENPFRAFAEITVSPDWPGVRDKLGGRAARLKSAWDETVSENTGDVEAA